MKYDHRSRLRLLTSASLVASALVCPVMALAQSAPAAPQASAEEAPRSDEIVVTGTSIRGVAPVGAPVVGIGSEDLGNRGATTLAESIRQLPQIMNLGISETQFGSANNANANTSAGTGINLRGLGVEASLVLVDGRRVPNGGVLGNSAYFDPSLIPSMAIQRIEVMADGGSAIYGADAVGGVVNLLMRRRYDGVELSARGGLGKDISQYVFNGIFGKTWNSGYAFIAGEYSWRSRLAAANRAFFTDDMRAFGGPDLRSFAGNPGNILVGTTRYGIPANQTGVGLTAGQLLAAPNRESVYIGADALSEQKRMSVAARLSQDLAPGVTLNVEGYAAKRETPRFGNRLESSLVVPRSNPFFLNPVNPAAANVTVQYSWYDDLGPTRNFGFTNSFFTTADLTVDIGTAWKATAYVAAGKTDDGTSLMTLNTAAVNRALADTNPATALNVFGDGRNTSQATLNGLVGVNYIVGKFYNHDFGAKIDGPLFDLPGGAVRVALGADHRWNKAVASRKNNATTTDINTYFVADFPVSRTIDSVYAEVYVPVTDATSGVGQLSLSGAGRYDHYSDFGGTFNPKIGFTWKTGFGLSLRGTYGTSYRAPTLGDVNVAGTLGVQVLNFADSSSLTGQTLTMWVRGANPDLKPETAKIYSLGADFVPESVPGLNLSLTYFKVDYTNRIETPGNDTNALNKEALLTGFITRNPPASLINQYLSLVTGAPSDITTIKAFVDGRKKNSGSVQTDGLEITAGYKFAAAGGEFNIGASGTHLFHFNRKLTPTSPTLVILDTVTNPISWQIRGQAGYRADKGLSANLFLNYFGSYTNNTVTPNVKVNPYASFDASLGYDLPADFRITLDIKNLTDKQPPFVQNGLLAFDAQVADLVGRYFLVGVSKRF